MRVDTFIFTAFLACACLCATTPPQHPPHHHHNYKTLGDTRSLLLDVLDASPPDVDESLEQTYQRVFVRHVLSALEPERAEVHCALVREVLGEWESVEDVAHALMIALMEECALERRTLERAASVLGEALEKEKTTVTLSEMRFAMVGLSALRQWEENRRERIVPVGVYEAERVRGMIEKVMSLIEDDGTFRPSLHSTEGDVLSMADALDILTLLGSLSHPSLSLDEWRSLARPLALTLALTHEEIEGGEESDESEERGLFARARKSGGAVFFDDLRTTARVFETVRAFAANFAPVPPHSVTPSHVLGVLRFVLRSLPHTPVECYYHVIAMLSLADNPFHRPSSLSQLSHLITTANPTPELNVTVVDVLGRPLTQPSVVTVATGPLANTVLTHDPTDNHYTLDLSPLRASGKLHIGVGEVTLRATPSSPHQLPVDPTRLIFHVVGELTIGSGEVRVVEGKSASASAPLSRVVTYPESLRDDDVIVLNSSKTLLISFSPLNKDTGKSEMPQQAMVRVSSMDSGGGGEAYVVAVPSSSTAGLYTATLSVEKIAADLNHRGGLCAVSVIVGDTAAFSPTTQHGGVEWALCRVDVQLPVLSRHTAAAAAHTTPLPPITHRFSPPHATVPLPVWASFTALTVLPLPLLLITLCGVGLNMRGLCALRHGAQVRLVCFWLCIACTAGVLAWYWVSLTMLQALVLLAVMAVPLIVMGMPTLRALQAVGKIE